MNAKSSKKRKMREMPILKAQVDRRIRTRSTPPASQHIYNKTNFDSAPDELESELLMCDPPVLEEIQNRDPERNSAGTFNKEFDSVMASIESVANGGGSISSRDLTDKTTIYCTLPWCNGSSEDPNITFVSFPKMKKKRLLKWAAALRWDDLKRQTICSLHFDPVKDFIVRDDGKKVLMPGTIPSRNWNTNIQEKEEILVEPDQENQQELPEEFYDPVPVPMNEFDEEPYPLMSYLYSKSLSLTSKKEETDESVESLALEMSDETDDMIKQFEENEAKTDPDEYENEKCEEQEPESLVVEIRPYDFIMDDQINSTLESSSENPDTENIETDNFGSIWEQSTTEQPLTPTSAASASVSAPALTPAAPTISISKNVKKLNLNSNPKPKSKNNVNKNGIQKPSVKEKKIKSSKKLALDAAKKDLIIEALKSSRDDICTKYDISESQLERIWSTHVREKRQKSSKKQKQQELTKIQENKETSANGNNANVSTETVPQQAPAPTEALN